MKTLKHHATKIVRPFLGWEDCKKLLSNAAIRLRPGDVPTTDESVTLKVEATSSLEIALFPNVEQSMLVSTFSSLGVPPKEIELSIFVNSPGLKKSQVAYKCPVSEVTEDEIV